MFNQFIIVSYDFFKKKYTIAICTVNQAAEENGRIVHQSTSPTTVNKRPWINYINLSDVYTTCTRLTFHINS